VIRCGLILVCGGIDRANLVGVAERCYTPSRNLLESVWFDWQMIIGAP